MWTTANIFKLVRGEFVDDQSLGRDPVEKVPGRGTNIPEQNRVSPIDGEYVGNEAAGGTLPFGTCNPSGLSGKSLEENICLGGDP